MTKKLTIVQLAINDELRKSTDREIADAMGLKYSTFMELKDTGDISSIKKLRKICDYLEISAHHINDPFHFRAVIERENRYKIKPTHTISCMGVSRHTYTKLIQDKSYRLKCIDIVERIAKTLDISMDAVVYG